MAKHRWPILNWSMIPDGDGDAFIEPYDIKATNDAWKRLVLIFNDSGVKDVLHGGFTVPQNYVGTPKLAITWTSTATSGDVEWDFDYRAVGGDDTESLDQATAQESVNLNDTAPSAIHEKMECLITLSANFAAGDEVEFDFGRDGADAGDTMAAAAIVFNVLFEYLDA
jgi:hypothetical protein